MANKFVTFLELLVQIQLKLLHHQHTLNKCIHCTTYFMTENTNNKIKSMY